MQFLPGETLLEQACACDGCKHQFQLVPVGASVFTALDGREVRRVDFDDPDDPFSGPEALCEDCHRQVEATVRWRADHPRPPDLVVYRDWRAP